MLKIIILTFSVVSCGNIESEKKEDSEGTSLSGFGSDRRPGRRGKDRAGSRQSLEPAKKWNDSNHGPRAVQLYRKHIDSEFELNNPFKDGGSEEIIKKYEELIQKKQVQDLGVYENQHGKKFKVYAGNGVVILLSEDGSMIHSVWGEDFDSWKNMKRDGKVNEN